MTVVNRALQPIKSLADAMSSIEAGLYDTRVKTGGSPELAAVCGKLNHLTSVLGATVEDKRHLAERVVSLQDVERKEIARDLHDEFGPHLFALRAHTSALTQLADTSKPDMDVLRKHIGAISDQVNALQQFNRRILERLRPVGLAELGLADALAALIRLWRETHPGVEIKTSISPSLSARGETAFVLVALEVVVGCAIGDLQDALKLRGVQSGRGKALGRNSRAQQIAVSKEELTIGLHALLRTVAHVNELRSLCQSICERVADSNQPVL
jgi:nitrate/nitrite-specific signal transduction histidine kinase